ncbi:MAG: BlaI/MecI/CopY family transcriptional regulator [Oscillospiraceae bacterium]|nr:BlaI/MecI/CopY family transcriptional regulator [Oscillospiraceae bacterium]MBQ3050227.1 BlaI/MecI/CopY family transcriptional regulator [Oscillospiraceae bacterium]MBQ9938599.1 BlaI/MecI/CopY family transcriptional regulator [Oscillospiraceae bacterium]
MTDYQLGALESRFADVIWANEPIASSELVKRSEELFGWKKSTTYTVLKRLCEKGLFQNIKGTVTSLMSRSEFYSAKSERFVNESFNGSLPAFIAAFSRRNALSPEDVAELKRIVEEYGEG